MTKGSLGKDQSGSGNTQTSGACRTKYQHLSQSKPGARYQISGHLRQGIWEQLLEQPIYCVHVCSTSAPQSSSAEEEEEDGAVHVSVKAVCVYGVVAKALLWDCGCMCLLGLGGRTAAASQLWACYGRIFPGSRSPPESAAFHKSTAASTFKLCLPLTLVLDKETSDLTSTVRAVIVLGLRICSYQAGSSSPWEQSSCELWMHRVCLRPSESGSAPLPRSHIHLSDSFWQHPLLTSSPSPLPSGYLEYRKTQQIVMNS